MAVGDGSGVEVGVGVLVAVGVGEAPGTVGVSDGWGVTVGSPCDLPQAAISHAPVETRKMRRFT